jgi:transposase
MAVDPDNRTVARTLERLWEDKLREKEEVERDYQRARHERRVDIGPADRARILELSRDLRRVWDAASTTDDQRKNLLRVLVQEVAISPVGDPRRAVHVEILWETGAVERFDVPLRRRVFPVNAALHAEVEALMREGLPDEEIARALNTRDVPSGRDRPWDAAMVGRTRRRASLLRTVVPDLPPTGARVRADGLWSARAVAQRFGVPLRLIQTWEARGLIRRVSGGGSVGKRKWFHLDQTTIERIDLAKDDPIPRREKDPDTRYDGLMSARGVANRLGVSPNRVHMWVADGALAAVEGGGKGRSLWFRLDQETIDRLTPSARRFRPRKNKLPRQIPNP